MDQGILDKHKAYLNKKNKLIQALQAIAATQPTIRLQKSTSNLFRNNKAINSHKIDVKNFNQVIEIDPVALTAEIEGMTTFETIVAETLKFNCLPLVVPELKSITIGGALSGVGIEASSFRYGFVHDGIIEFEVLTGDGKIAICNAENEHSDLFYAFPNSYGTLGYALKVKVKLIPALPFVELTYHHFKTPQLFFQQIENWSLAQHKSGDISFIEGVIFNSNHFVISTAKFVDNVSFISNYRYMQIYYKSIQQKTMDYLTTKDFIWRWDPDWFWCSKIFGMQNRLLRFLFGKWTLKSTVYWQIMRFINKNWIANYFYQRKKLFQETVIQDVLIPIEQCKKFYDFFTKNIDIMPIWICPYIAYNKARAYDFFPTKFDQLYLDFGFWDSVPSNGIPGFHNRLIEHKVVELNGHKSLYSEAFYPEEEFWQIYNKHYYQILKQKYDPQNVFNNIYQKCVLEL